MENDSPPGAAEPPANPGPFDPATLTDDPEIAALLDFEPVVRKCIRHDGWWPEHQYRFIVGVAETGNPDKVAHALGGRTFSGAWKLRKAGGGEGFAKAWDGAKALYFARNPPQRRASAAPLPGPEPAEDPAEASTPGRRPWRFGFRRKPRATKPGGIIKLDRHFGPPPPEPPVSEDEMAGFSEGLLRLYYVKLCEERRNRLAGEIAAADFAVRQLSFIELVLDLTGRAKDALDTLRCGDFHVLQVQATPMSVLLDRLRREFWRNCGEADRPPSSPFDDNGDGIGLPRRRHFRGGGVDGDYDGWTRAEAANRRDAAEAQKAWEAQAKADAAAWRERMARDEPEKLAEILEPLEAEREGDDGEEAGEPDDAADSDEKPSQ